MFHLLPDLIESAHPLALVHDPDLLLAGDEAALGELAAAGRRLVMETDPVALRVRVQEAPPGAALVIITPAPLAQLPYDLWQRGEHIHLALHDLFPNLDYPTLAELSAAQRERLGRVVAAGGAPVRLLAAGQTQDFLLDRVFDASATALAGPAALVLWLDAYHSRNDPMPAVLARRLAGRLDQNPAFGGWPLADLLADADAFRAWVAAGWDGFVSQTFGEQAVEYRVAPPPGSEQPLLSFGDDPALQDAVPRLVRSGALMPRTVLADGPLPVWLLPAVAVDAAGVRRQQVEAGLAGISEQLQAGELRWEQWQRIAWRWAQLSLWRYGAEGPLAAEMAALWTTVEVELDRRFLAWLRDGYAPLALRALPHPHHVHHIPAFLAHNTDATEGRTALVVLDGMAVADWLLVRKAWQVRRPAWRLTERLLLAQIPSITAISRQALISGRRPVQFAASLTHNRREAELWAGFWRGQDYPDGASALHYLPDRANAGFPSILEDRRLRALCLVSPVIDAMTHGATQGAAGLMAALAVWLQSGSSWLEALIDRLLAAGYTVHLASDHGHVEARGFGQPQEGVLVETRSLRARVYDNEHFAQAVRQQVAGAVIWHDDGLLPANRWVLMPQGRRAFAPPDQVVVSHGGLTLEEMVTPFVTISAGAVV